MKTKIFKKLIAFTIAEVMLTFIIIGIIAVAVTGISKAKISYAYSCAYYAAFRNLKQAAGEIVSASSTLPATGTGANGLCQVIGGTNGVFNTIPSTIDCTKTTTTTFTDANMNFKTTNGMRFFNFASAPTTNVSPPYSYYKVFVDIDGDKGPASLSTDVMAFYIFTNGVVLPAENSYNGADPTFITASVKLSTNGVISWPTMGVSYRQAICTAGDVINPTAYGSVAGTFYQTYCSGITQNAACTTIGNYCETVIAKP